MDVVGDSILVIGFGIGVVFKSVGFGYNCSVVVLNVVVWEVVV